MERKQPNWNDASVQTHFRREIIWKHGLCQCGSGASWQIMLELLERAVENDEGGKRTGFYTGFEDASGRWAEFGAHVLDSMGLVEHGTGIGWPWLTDNGWRLLSFLREFKTDGENWPEWSCSEEV